jgi:hypothetical protein
MTPKEHYEKPELVPIELKAEEVLAVGCKTVGRTARASPIPQPVCGFAAGCNTRGS